MEIKLTFLGAAGNVTGSRYLLEVDKTKLLVDCGYFQEWKIKDRNWEPSPVPPGDIDAVLLTHAHLDHCGLLPRLVAQGFEGKIYCTSATAEIAKIIVQDSAKIQEEDVKHKIKRHKREGRKGPHPLVPLYTAEDAEATLPLFQPVKFTEPVEVADGITATYRTAGHILGAASILVSIERGGDKRTILFSGDIGGWDMPILKDPVLPELAADYVLIESTYGDRVHEDSADIPGQLERIINETRKRGGNIIIPSFAVERAQDILYHLGNLLREKRIPQMMVMVDSPMAIRVTDVFRKHPHLFDEETDELLRKGKHPCDFPSLQMCRTTNQSKAINQIKASVIVIAGSGMCTGGRIKHHLINNIGRPESTILFVGYQAGGTMGRHILNGADKVRIFGQEREIHAHVERVEGFSGHGDRNDLFRWVSALTKKPRRVFVTHGEPDSSKAFAEMMETELGFETVLPQYKETHVLD